MDTIFINLENSKTSDPHRSVLNLADKVHLKRCDKYFTIQYTWKNNKMQYKNKTFNISAPTWSEEFDLPNGLMSVSDIQDLLSKYIIKIHEMISHDGIIWKH